MNALRERRDAREELIRDGRADFDVISEWISINGYLAENGRMLSMLDQVDEELRTKIIDANFHQLLASKQYKIAEAVLDNRGRMFFNWEFMYETDRYFQRMANKPGRDHKGMVEHSRQVMRRNGLEVFELALAVRRIAPAQEVARRILLHCGDAETYLALLEIAMRFGPKTISNQLLTKAKKQLSPEDFARITQKANL